MQQPHDLCLKTFGQHEYHLSDSPFYAETSTPQSGLTPASNAYHGYLQVPLPAEFCPLKCFVTSFGGNVCN